MNPTLLSRWKLAAILVLVVSLTFLTSVPGALVVTATNQNEAEPFTPNGQRATNNLIGGLLPSRFAGNFSLEALGRNVACPGSGNPVTVADDTTGNQQGFYRLFALP